MLLLLLAYLGGVLTIVSPCILPVLPFVFARSGQSFLKSTLPMLAGMAATFAAVASLAAIGGGWAVAANQYGRGVALAVLAGFGLILLFPVLSDKATRPLVALGARLSDRADREGRSTVAVSLLLGVATGLLWAPCAGPVLGLILTGAALHGANLGTSLLLLAYALGAATSLALALLVGGRVFRAMKNALGAGILLRRGLGLAVVAASVAIGLGVDTRLLAQGAYASTDALEQGLLNHLRPAANIGLKKETPASVNPATSASRPIAGLINIAAQKADVDLPLLQAKFDLPIEPTQPDLDGAVQWLNSPPLTLDQLKGKVVLIDFWTFGCINCLHTLPHVKEWAAKYADKGLVVIGVHAPEFAYEKDPANVKKAVADLGITFPVALDNNFTIWRQFSNEYWPANYFIDAEGHVRYHHFGEGAYEESELVIQQLLAEADKAGI
jgi:cytochrome c biogenesis protein CcdA/thiol-disulfide isomerase/thioredoxin